MIVRGWAGATATAVGAAAAASAAQLGLAYGMDVVSWPATAGDRAAEAWTIGLTWATWVAASSTVAGAIVADRVGSAPGDTRQQPAPSGDPVPGSAGTRGPVLRRLALAAAAAFGAAATVVLIAVPARVADVAGVASPQTVATGYALLGVAAGLLLAVAALTARAAAVNLLATASWAWLLAVVAVVDGVLDGADWSRVPLAFWELPAPWLRDTIVVADAVPLAAALVVGALTALPAARRGDPPVGVAVSGTAGPLVVAAAYLLAQPTLGQVTALELSHHLVAPYLVLAGLAGSLLASTVARRPGTGDGAPEDGDGAGNPQQAADGKPGVPAARGAAAREPTGRDTAEPVAG